MSEQSEAARLAGWDRGGEAPFEHGLPPEIDPELGHNGVPAPEPGDEDYTEPAASAPDSLGDSE